MNALGWLKEGPLGFARRALSYRNIDVARVIQRNLTTIVTPTHSSGNGIAIPELGIVIDPFRNEDILIALPHLVALKRREGATFRVTDRGDLEISVSGVLVLCETLQDILFAHEVYDTQVYALQMPARTTVWDIGANIGTSSLFFAKCCGWDVIAYEPFPKTAESARANIARNHLEDRIELREAGIGGRAREEALSYYHDWRGGNGLFGNTRQGPVGEATSVTVQILDAVTEFQRVQQKAAGGLILAKIDCEGAEYEILRRLQEAQCLELIDAIVLEVHQIPGQDGEEPLSILLKNSMMIVRHERLGDGLQMIYAVKVRRVSDS